MEDRKFVIDRMKFCYKTRSEMKEAIRKKKETLASGNGNKEELQQEISVLENLAI